MKWKHPHTAATGLIAGLIAAQNGWLILALCVACLLVGFLAGRFALRARQLAELAARRVAAAAVLAEEKIKTEKVKATEIRTRQKNRRRTRAEQEKAEKRAYTLGAVDQIKRDAA